MLLILSNIRNVFAIQLMKDIISEVVLSFIVFTLLIIVIIFFRNSMGIVNLAGSKQEEMVKIEKNEILKLEKDNVVKGGDVIGAVRFYLEDSDIKIRVKNENMIEDMIDEGAKKLFLESKQNDINFYESNFGVFIDDEEDNLIIYEEILITGEE